jgi:hypothetical protein
VTRKISEQLNLALLALQLPIKIVEQCGQRDTEFLLKMAILNLKIKIFRISEPDVRALYGQLATEQENQPQLDSNVVDARRHFRRKKKRISGNGPK